MEECKPGSLLCSACCEASEARNGPAAEAVPWCPVGLLQHRCIDFSDHPPQCCWCFLPILMKSDNVHHKHMCKERRCLLHGPMYFTLCGCSCPKPELRCDILLPVTDCMHCLWEPLAMAHPLLSVVPWSVPANPAAYALEPLCGTLGSPHITCTRWMSCCCALNKARRMHVSCLNKQQAVQQGLGGRVPIQRRFCEGSNLSGT